MRRMWLSWGWGGCGGVCRKDWKGLSVFFLYKKGVVVVVVRFLWVGL